MILILINGTHIPDTPVLTTSLPVVLCLLLVLDTPRCTDGCLSGSLLLVPRPPAPEGWDKDHNVINSNTLI